MARNRDPEIDSVRDPANDNRRGCAGVARDIVEDIRPENRLSPYHDQISRTIEEINRAFHAKLETKRKARGHSSGASDLSGDDLCDCIIEAVAELDAQRQRAQDGTLEKKKPQGLQRLQEKP